MSCPSGPCPLEQAQQSQHSLGPVSDDEFICRGAIHERHGNASTGSINAAIIERAKLASGAQSAWRAGKMVGWDLEDVRDELRKDELPNQPLFKIVGVRAKRIRNLKSKSGAKLCVVDETLRDHDGNHHAHHAHITPCRSDPAHPLNDPKAGWVRVLQEELVTLFKDHPDVMLRVEAPTAEANT
jgi:hypothetical protein